MRLLISIGVLVLISAVAILASAAFNEDPATTMPATPVSRKAVEQPLGLKSLRGTRWSYEAQGLISGMAEGTGGNLLIASEDKQKIYLAGVSTSSGKPVWAYSTPRTGVSHIIRSDGRYIAVRNTDFQGPRSLLVLDAANGKKLWHISGAPGSRADDKLEVVDGKVYLAVDSAGRGHIRAFDARTGRLLWEEKYRLATHVPYDLGAPPPGGHQPLPVLTWLVTSGQVYVGTADGLKALDPNTGKLLWATDAGRNRTFEEILPYAGTVVARSIPRDALNPSGLSEVPTFMQLEPDSGKKLYSVSSRNTEAVGRFRPRGAAIADDRMAYSVSGFGDKFSMIHADDVGSGKRKWSFETYDDSLYDLMASEGTLYFSARQDRELKIGVGAIDTKTGSQLWRWTAPPQGRGSASQVQLDSRIILGEAALYFAAHGKVYALR